MAKAGGVIAGLGQTSALQQRVLDVVQARTRQTERPSGLRLLEIGGATLPQRTHPRRVAVVTGGNRGMGLETCRQLGREGMTVLLTSRDHAAGKAAARELRAEGHDVQFLRVDVTDDRSVQNLAGYLEHTYGRVDVLVNNAGAIFESIDDVGRPDARTLEQTDEATLSRSVEVNTFGPVRLVQTLAPFLQGGEGGTVINISSALATDPTVTGVAAYRLSKAMLNEVSLQLADELDAVDVRVYSVDPGWVQTGMGGPNAPLTTEEGVAQTVWLASQTGADRPASGHFEPT